jgi:N-acetyl sugar amidotransferase
MPDSKPDLTIDHDGVCSACQAFEKRSLVNWIARRGQLETLLSTFRSQDGSWDCVIPVSGGKDSTYQVIKMLEFGMNPLCVTATTCDFSEIGRRNIDNLKRLGVDHIQVSPNPETRAMLNRIGLMEVGDISWPEHVGIFTVPVRVAINYGIHLIIWGENSQNEYGGPAIAQDRNVLDRAWLEEFGGLLGLRVGDLAEVYGIARRFLNPYQYPTEHQLEAAKISGLFLGHYLPWDGLTNFLLSQASGFESMPMRVEGSMVSYENVDNFQTGIHDYFKYLKFGFSRATDLACLHVRRGRISRQEALEIVRSLDGRFPWTYLGKPVEEILRPLKITVDEFVGVCDRFTNHNLFRTDSTGQLIKRLDGSPELISSPT